MTGYTFKRVVLGQFYVHISYVEPGMIHKKKFISASTAQTQHTLNIYVKGKFRVSCGQNVILYSAGDSSLDWPWEYRAGDIVTEEPLESGVRVCVQPIEKISWSKTCTIPKPKEVLEGNLIVILDNKIKLANTYTATGLESAVWSFSV